MRIQNGCRWALLIVSLSWLAPTAGQTISTEPVEGLRDKTPAFFALLGGKIVQSGQTLEAATIVIRDGRIVQVGKDVSPPADCRRIDLAGRVIYPGFIDAWSAAEMPDSSSGAPYWNASIQPQRLAAAHYAASPETNESLRSQGFGARLVAPQSGIIQGVSAVVLLGEGDNGQSIIQERAALHLRLTVSRFGGRSDEYPGSPMGAVALARQAFYDAQWNQAAHAAHRADPSLPRPPGNDALDALQIYVQRGGLVIAEAGNELFCLRADQFAREFGLRLAIHGSGNEYRRLNAIQATGRTIIVPLDFPKPPNVATADAARDVTLEALLHWDIAPENPARLHQAGIPIALTTEGLSSPKDFLNALRTAVQRGLPAEAALQALTVTPARLLGCEDQLGAVRPGAVANLVVADSDLFTDATSEVIETWVGGRRFLIQPPKPAGVQGMWSVTLRDGPAESSWRLNIKSAGEAASNWQATLEPKTGEPLELQKVGLKDDRFSAVLAAAPFGGEGLAYLTAIVLDDGKRLHGALTMTGREPVEFRAVFLTSDRPPAPKPEKKPKNRPQPDTPTDPDAPSAAGAAEAEAPSAASITDERTAPAAGKRAGKGQGKGGDSSQPASFPVVYPLGAFGREQLPAQQRVLFRNATVWTCGPEGVLTETDVLIDQGKIVELGKSLQDDKATLIDVTGKHLSPGIIDCHSHMATDGGVNEGTQAITAEVRIGDFIDSDDINIYRQLAGGVTAANILHGSANPIGGQNQVIKLRWAALPEEMKFDEAPAGIKFALGENVKQSNWGDDFRTRYPQTRMGVIELIRDAFQAAKEYRRKQSRWQKDHRGLPPRRDLELEALAEVLEGSRWIHCHSYRQDEILALLRTLEDFQITIGSLQHILEGYKVADAMARHGATGSSFSDWWAYKFEVYDAIPYNGALMHNAGVIVSFNSDDRELARHLNHEAAKAVKYGGVPAEEALKFVTLNAARQLRIDAYVGSIEIGKHADLVVWNERPLSTFSRCEQTWVDGRLQFDRDNDQQMRQQARQWKARLIAKILDSGQEMRKPGEGRQDESEYWPREDEYCHHHQHDDARQ